MEIGNSPWGNEKTEIVLSFAIKNHGGFFANWLRDRLRKTFGFYGVVEVYMDNIALRSGLPTMHTNEFVPGSDRVDGVTYITRDTQDKFKGGDAQEGASNIQDRGLDADVRPIGALNSQWNDHYKAAISQCHTMIFCVTKEFTNNKNTMLEVAQFREENEIRLTAGKPLVRGIALVFPGAANSQEVTGTPEMTMIMTTKTQGSGGLLWHPKSFGISESDYSKVAAIIRERKAG